MTQVEIVFSEEAMRQRAVRSERLVLLTKDGRQLMPQRGRGYPGGRASLGFAVRRDEAVSLLYAWQPYETRQVRNVSLQPGARTAVAVSNPRDRR
jgi:hypothetical protein